MTIHLYFSLIPEALIASMLPPEQFGQYYATGHKYKSKGQAIFLRSIRRFATSFSISTRGSSAVFHTRMALLKTRFTSRFTGY